MDNNAPINNTCQVFNFDDFIKGNILDNSSIKTTINEEAFVEDIVMDSHIVTEKNISLMENNIIDDLTSSFNSKIKITEQIPKKYVIVIDNDECIGSWGDLSLLYSMFKKEDLLCESKLDLFVNIMIKTKCIRPYVKEFYHKILKLKKKGIVSKIVMCTAASNSIGWVTYLSKILERWIGCTIYDEIIFQEILNNWHLYNKSDACNNIGYIKNMDMVREIMNFKYMQNPNNYDIIVIDDRPSNILNGITIGVAPYNVAINMFEVLRLYLPDKYEYLMVKYENTINSSWDRYMYCPHDYTNANLDRDIFDSIEYIEKIIFIKNV